MNLPWLEMLSDGGSKCCRRETQQSGVLGWVPVVVPVCNVSLLGFLQFLPKHLVGQGGIVLQGWLQSLRERLVLVSTCE